MHPKIMLDHLKHLHERADEGDLSPGSDEIGEMVDLEDRLLYSEAKDAESILARLEAVMLILRDENPQDLRLSEALARIHKDLNDLLLHRNGR